jgi:hypothetical protein
MGPAAVGNKNLTDEVILQRALRNLEKLDVVGITEELDDMLYQVRPIPNTFANRNLILTRINFVLTQLKFHLPQLVPSDFTGFKRDNVHGKRSVIDEETKAILREWGWVDDRLYKAAQRIYKAKQQEAKHCLGLFGEL